VSKSDKSNDNDGVIAALIAVIIIFTVASFIIGKNLGRLDQILNENKGICQQYCKDYKEYKKCIKELQGDTL